MNWEASALEILAASLVRPFFLAAAAFLTIRIFRIEHPASKHVVWRAALVGMVLLPFASVLAPALELPAFPEGSISRVEFAWFRTPKTARPDPAAPADSVSISEATAAATPAQSPVLPAHENSPHRNARPSSAMRRPLSLQAFLLAVYLAGLCACVAYRSIGWVLMRRLVAQSRPLGNHCLRQSSAIVVPVAVGLWRPVVLLPVEWRRWDATTRRAALAHEFEHLRRRDAWTLTLSRWATCLFWFHPLVWQVVRTLSELAEMACDARAVGKIRDAERYSRILVEFAATVSRRGFRTGIAGLTMVGSSRLDRRIDQIFAVSKGNLRRLHRPAVVLGLIGIPILACATTLRVTEFAAKPLAQVKAAVAASLVSVPGAESLLSAVAAAAESVGQAAETVQGPQPAVADRLSAAEVKVFVDGSCGRCHGLSLRSRVPTWAQNSNFDLADFDPATTHDNADVLERAVRRIRSGFEASVILDPDHRADPVWVERVAQVQRVAQWLEVELDRTALPYMPAPGPHRLNRTEYGNAIRDLLGLDFNPALVLQADTGFYFDNTAAVLAEVLKEQPVDYETAASVVAGMAMSAPSRQTFFLCQPADPGEFAPCAERIVRNLATRAFRRPATEVEVSELMTRYRSAYRTALSGFQNFDGVYAVLNSILTDREFLYRIEAEPVDITVGKPYRVSDLELASRLSFFLWSTIPDERLIDLAGRGQLRNPVVLEQETRRMLKDPRAQALTANFSSQWLGLRWWQGVSYLPQYRGDYSKSLQEAMRREVELFFNSIVEEDRNVVDLLTADYTFLNEQLARHYDIVNVEGSAFRRVTLGPRFDARRGLLGKGAILMLTSNSTRTSIVNRGQWVLRHFLGIEAPPPPPNVLPLPQLGTDPNMRDAMEKANSISPSCRGCHRIIDPVGIALENFDRAGKWRINAGTVINAKIELMDGTEIDGPAGLRNALVARSDQFVRTLTEQLLMYALGRRTDYRDMPAIRSIARNAARDNNRFSAIVLGIVKSDTFQMNMKFAASR